MATIATYIPYSELNEGKPSTLEEFQNEIGKFARSRMLHLCSVMNAMLRSENEIVNWRAHDALVKSFFEPEVAKQLLPKNGDVRFVFYRQQLLFVAKTAVMFCSEEGTVPDPDQFTQLGRVFLMAGDHLPVLVHAPEPLDDKFAFRAAQFLPIQEASEFHRYDHKIARSFTMLSETVPQVPQTNDVHFNISESFEKITGISLLSFQALLFGSLSKFRKFDPEAYQKDPRTYGLDEKWFASTKISADAVSKFLNLVSSTPGDFKEAYKKNWGASDFTPFRDRPLFRDGDRLYLIDFAFLAEKFESAPFWTVHNSLLSKKNKDDLHAFWGRVFEQYSVNVFQSQSAAQLNNVHSGPAFVDESKGQVCDLIVVCGVSAAFIEVKGSTFSSRAKYGSDSNLLKDELDSKLVQEPDGEAKAVYQLKRAIELTCGETPELVQNIDLSKVKFIYPIVITRDDIGSTSAVNAFLQVRFDAAFNRKKHEEAHYTVILY